MFSYHCTLALSSAVTWVSMELGEKAQGHKLASFEVCFCPIILLLIWYKISQSLALEFYYNLVRTWMWLFCWWWSQWSGAFLLWWQLFLQGSSFFISWNYSCFVKIPVILMISYKWMLWNMTLNSIAHVHIQIIVILFFSRCNARAWGPN